MVLVEEWSWLYWKRRGACELLQSTLNYFGQKGLFTLVISLISHIMGSPANVCWGGLVKQELDFSMLKAFGCKGFVVISYNKRNKLKPKSQECIFLRFVKGVTGFRQWDLAMGFDKQESNHEKRGYVWWELYAMIKGKIGSETIEEVKEVFTEVPISASKCATVNQFEIGSTFGSKELDLQQMEIHKESTSIAQIRKVRT